ncbi:site-specific integrase [Actinomycetospora sp. TBRC 11914]|uniref:tyrosine-type recombinase/integrase n=1 Tax=Actinomycetospora sp. TBRC 11914 TaxID=2729387 RepID=UPI00145EB3FC|nr:site-specific integrase [Actinomycetospora sp. TBRC 11914]NMO90618.1 site-specific integrase [Actinomycetospora sp. TBRC 11914]
MGWVQKVENKKWRVFWRDPTSTQRSKTFTTKKEADAFLAETESAKSRGLYVSPHAGRTTFGDHATAWMASWNTERTTAARDRSVMRTHVLPQWESWPLGKIDHLSMQSWVTDLGHRRSRATVAEAHRLTSAVLRSAVRNRLIAFNPALDVRVPKRRKTDTDEQIISRPTLRQVLLPQVPEQHRALIATAAGCGLRWGEVAGLMDDALDLEAGVLRVVRTVVEVAGHRSFKPFPKSVAGRREVPIPAWVRRLVAEHVERWPSPATSPVFANEIQGPIGRTAFRARVWRPSLVRAGFIGDVSADGNGFLAVWRDRGGDEQSLSTRTYYQAVMEVSRRHFGGLRFHDLRHSYATWLVDDGVPPNMVQRVMGHERASTTLDLYTRRTADTSRILAALTDDEEDER